MKRIATALMCAALAGCMASNPVLFEKRPTEWTQEELQIARTGEGSFEDLCQLYNDGAQGLAQLTPADFQVLNSVLRQKGLNRRDLEIMRDTTADFGTGQSYRGLKCLHGWEISVINEAFYPGIGHQWQTQLGESYIYLEGNNTDTGMRVRSWN